jgi:chromosome segregation protein
MRIKRLDITGFKSFMERMVFSFDDGITAVVGPNGCGKSNVVDAIRWAMGEQSAKNLRGRGMEDVIFNGSETHPPLSMAEVTITFKVEAHDTLPETLAGLPEVSVTRRLFRSGESEYQINRTTTRLLDVTELFLGTGIGTKAYSIIEQGRVGQIVSARPEDRRSFIEEAAGITKYKARRKVAERKMEYTQANLLRVTDIVVELEKRLDSLERQAKKAEKYKRLKSEMKTIELHDYSHKWLELGAKKKSLEAQLASLSESERERVEAVRTLETEIAQRREALEKATQELEAHAQATYALEGEVKLDAQNLGHWQQDLDATRSRTHAAQGELSDVSQRKAAIDAEKGIKEEELSKLGVASREDEVTLEVRDEELRRSAELSKNVSERLAADRQELAELERKTSAQAARLSGLDARKSELAQRIARVDGELEGLRAEEATLERARSEVLERVESSRLVTQELSQRRGEEEAVLARLREAFAENEVLVLASREALSDKRSRLSSLEEIQKNYEGYDRGVRAVMMKAGAEPEKAGIFGLVADVVSAPAEYEKAVEGALGERLQHVVVESRDRGFELVEYLKGLAEGRSTFVPVPAERPQIPEPLQAPGVLAMALSQVEVKQEALKPLVERLLGGVAIVPDLAVAKELSARAPAYTFVTLDGETVGQEGTVTGGALEGPAVGALQKKREIAELSLEVKQIEERYNELITRHYELQKQTGHAEGVLKGLDKNTHAEELSLATHEKDLHTAGSGLVKLRERIQALATEQGELTRTVTSVDLELEAARGEAAHGETDRQAREDRVRLLQSELESLEARAQAIQVETTELKVKVASTSERGQAARAAVDALATQASELAERHARLAATVEEGQARIAELSGKLEETAQAREARKADLDAKKAGLEEEKARHAEALNQVRSEEERLKSLRSTLDEMTSGLSNLSVEERTLAMEQEHIVAALQERHGLSIGEAVHQAHLLPPLGPDAHERLKELRAQVERMGEVNVTAIDEHKEIAERFEFLSRQKKDLEESLKQLTHAIEKIDETSRVRFKETFDVVNEKFQAVFPRLFGGGRASLHLVQGGPGEEPGVEILAQPPGKKLQSVALFSGGEKALTAVALIFGIFLIKPTPFCLLDEVDAPLDEGNVGRYNEMVREMSKASQFILITHNKRTMEYADTLYGVTMQEPGVSKLVTVKLKEAAAANDTQVA